MEKVCITIVLIFWIIATIILTLSVVGLVIYIRSDNDSKYHLAENGEPVWFKLGKKLINKLIA